MRRRGLCGVYPIQSFWAADAVSVGEGGEDGGDDKGVNVGDVTMNG